MYEKNKVAQITLLFWLMKIIATTLGETFGDFLSMTVNLGYSVSLGITVLAFLLVLVIQLRSKTYIPVIFWLVIIATTTLGTEISDFIDRSLHLGYTAGSILLLSCLILTLFIWHRKFKNLEVYPIVNNKREMFYWIAILFSNSLGTAFGDYLSDVAGLSYLEGALVTAGVIAVVILLHYNTKLNEVLLFWLAFVFTRPFGATFGDFLTKPAAKGGLDLGTVPASLVAMIVLTILVLVAHRQEKNKKTLG
ncbi:putative membrane-anchored protein [Roseivirga pacifica]|uniref:Uncharacterized membrane-anchored protein n=1 Tax=Roseivirga pacifica TaxID=1267423 RepID=A0A1I0Q193_9BACT|nr:hypothetical protein [Roseivirga pacifica]RKQ43349.1 putative membrane-anchored protein [Roseivirga pacifica]SEW20568.1 Uncharacterized membrane-anchored protein [Roseivirga pacifica]